MTYFDHLLLVCTTELHIPTTWRRLAGNTSVSLRPAPINSCLIHAGIERAGVLAGSAILARHATSATSQEVMPALQWYSACHCPAQRHCPEALSCPVTRNSELHTKALWMPAAGEAHCVLLENTLHASVPA